MNRLPILLFVFVLIGAAPRRPEIVTIPASPVLEVKAGGQTEFALNFKILKGYHIQANPASEEYLIPTKASLQSAEGISTGTPIYPKGVSFQLQGSDKAIQTYEDEATIRIPLNASPSANPGEIILKGSLNYQGCDATTCFPPKTIPFEAKINIVKP
jgi:DsbC/DsbD-like thiol-disulfide interchange protein